MSTVTASMFTHPLGDDAVLIPRTPEIAEAYQALLEANHRERIARWNPAADDHPPTLAQTREALVATGRAWLDGTLLPLAIAVPEEDRWRLVGTVGLRIDRPARSGEVGYWIEAAHEGRGLVTRSVAAVLDQAFGPLGLRRVELRTNPDNERSQRVARRLGFTQEGVLRQAAAFPDGRRDEVVYGLLAEEWSKE
ncbi:GNAT family protein [Streptomyces sp. NPDC006678]|uniref:GNAT family N-acetyltransferase n=1 Tax=Streptomyces sp. NPDC006678 TaxID=3157185 RepID=UPI0033E4B692